MELNRKKLNKIYFHHDKFNREVTHKRRSCFVTADADFDYVSSDDEYTSPNSEEVTYVQEVVVEVSTSKML